VTADGTGRRYNLTIQKQPGLRPGPLDVTIRVPDGARITTTSGELTVLGTTATLETTFDADIELEVRFD